MAVPAKAPSGTRYTKMMQGKYMHPVTIRTEGDYHFLSTPFALKDEAKMMQGARWMGNDKIHPEKVWRVNNVRRNNFNIAYLEGQRPFARYTKPLLDQDGQGFRLRKTRTNWRNQVIPLFQHQLEMTLHMLIRRQCIIAGEMGTGKTLAAIEAMELSLVPEVWYIAPKSALVSVKLECMKWKCRTKIRYMTYDELKKVLANWISGDPPPRMVIFDESSRVKTHTSQRSQAAFHLAEAMRDAYGDDAYIILMSGSPAPKSPLDWYWQCEIACPGFLREGDYAKFTNRLAVLELNEDTAGTKFNKMVCWKDGNEKVCGQCGKAPEDLCHTEIIHGKYHNFKQLPNEVSRLYKSMSGLVYVKFKKDCLDLPEKQYRIIRIRPTIDLLRAAKIVQAGCRTTIQSLTLMRELSDGFQYRDVKSGTEVCEACEGNKVRHTSTGAIPCDFCTDASGQPTGSTHKVAREIVEVDSPKLDVVSDLLEENEEQGRIVMYAGFTASIDRLCAHVKKQGWEWIRVDGKGWKTSLPSFGNDWKDLSLNKEFQDPDSKYSKIAFIAHPGSAGMGLTLTAASMIVYVSNDFNGESRIQSEDRIHRAGMDVNRGATIVDLILLPTDEKVLDNLKRKRELQSMSLGEVSDAIDNFKYTELGEAAPAMAAV